jgi:hypothetical protein
LESLEKQNNGDGQQITGKLAEFKVDTEVFVIQDNNVYYSLQEDGNICPARKDNNGSVDGDLITCSKSAQHALFHQVKPILEAARGRNCILVPPLPKYLKTVCCQDVEHMVNRGTEGFEKQLLQDLKEMADKLRDFTFTAGFRQFKIQDPMIR